MKYTHLLWDFNGTILSDMEIGIESVNQMLRKRGLKEIESLEAYREIFDFPIQDYYKTLGFDFEKEPYHEVLAPMWVDLYNAKSHKAGLCEGVQAALEYAASLGVKQSILSACEIGMLLDMLKRLGVAEYFEHVWGLDNIHAASKLHLAKAWREQNPDARVLYVGDTVHDAETAATLQADCVLYAGGHQSRSRLLAAGYPVIEHFEELKVFLQGVSPL